MQNVKTAPKAKATKTATIVADKPATARETHAESGVTAKHYAGLSSYLNANRKARVNVYTGRDVASLTARMLGTLRAMRDAYGTKHFIASGFDNGAVSHLAAAGLLRIIETSGQRNEIAGKTYATDGETPLKLSVTAAGQSFGQAKA